MRCKVGLCGDGGSSPPVYSMFILIREDALAVRSDWTIHYRQELVHLEDGARQCDIGVKMSSKAKDDFFQRLIHSSAHRGEGRDSKIVGKIKRPELTAAPGVKFNALANIRILK